VKAETAVGEDGEDGSNSFNSGAFMELAQGARDSAQATVEGEGAWQSSRRRRRLRRGREHHSASGKGKSGKGKGHHHHWLQLVEEERRVKSAEQQTPIDKVEEVKTP